MQQPYGLVSPQRERPTGDDMQQATPESVIRWLLDQEIAGSLEGLTAVAITTGGRVHYISLRNASAPRIDQLRKHPANDGDHDGRQCEAEAQEWKR